MTDDEKQHDTPTPAEEERQEQIESDTAPTGEESREPAQKRPAGAGLALFIAWLGLLAALALGGGGYYLWQQLQQQETAQQRELARQNNTLETLRREAADRDDRQDNRLEELITQADNLDQALQNLLKSRSHLRNDWLLTEAEYLLKLANHRLLLERDVATAIVALQSADDRLREVADPGLLAIRKRVADDINALRNIDQPDLAGLSFTLSSLANDISDLPLATPEPLSRQQQEAAPKDQQIENWRELPAALWRDIKSLVVIRHHDEPIQPLLAPEQRFFLTQNLQLQLEQARLALLHGQTRVYRERLQQARQWIEQYFDTEQNPTRQLLAQLAQLAQTEIHPALPDISGTHQALQEYRQHRQDELKPDPQTEPESPANADSPSS